MECFFKIIKSAAAANTHEKLFNRSFARSGRLITLTSTFITLDITETSSNNCLLYLSSAGLAKFTY